MNAAISPERSAVHSKINDGHLLGVRRMGKIHRLIDQNSWLTWSISLLLLTIIFIQASCPGGSPAEASPGIHKEVLIIDSFSANHPFYKLFNEGLQDRLQERNVGVYYESLDLIKFSLDEDFCLNLAATLERKYADNLPDLILVNGKPAANFLLRFGHKIFSDIPVIVSVYNYAEVIRPIPDNYRIFTTPIDIERNLQLILNLKPDTRKIYVVIGETRNQKYLYEDISRQLAAFTGRVEISFLKGMPFPDLLDRIKHIEGNAVIFYTSFGEDVQGNIFVPAKAAEEICAVSPVPVFGITETYLDSGCIGGYMQDPTSLGMQLAEEVNLKLQGKENAGSPVVELDTARYAFEWSQLRRWNIDEHKLPPASFIRNKPNSLWDNYRTYIISAILLFILQSTLLVLLFINMRRRKKAEQGLARLERLNLVGEMAASIGHEVRNPMTTVRGYLQLFMQKQEFVKYREQLATMVEELDRANGIITEFLSLAKNKAVELKPGNINETIHALFPLLQAEAFRFGHQIITDTGNIPIINYDEKDIRQLILNLVRNGFESMAASGILTIKTYYYKGIVTLLIQDTGPGMPKEILKKIGTPFISTKEGGTGLGLSVCYRIAERHKAKISIDSSPAGTVFHIQFPVY